MPENGQVKTDVELLKRDMELVSALAEKFDIAIDRLTEVSTSVDKMLAVSPMSFVCSEMKTESSTPRSTKDYRSSKSGDGSL